MVILKILGALLIVLGVGDLIMNRIMEIDIWTEYLNVDLAAIHPLVYRFSAMGAIVLGAILWGIGSSRDEDDEQPDQTS